MVQSYNENELLKYALTHAKNVHHYSGENYQIEQVMQIV
ncbi:MAG: hypothetical protein Q8P05_01640 [Candidatus Diapherotrites archaeon]|nr:hypothetical protein [Candidatus Diapherotrites archaeon]MDZ4256677.1 hypothetical protein [archaeon]